MPARGSVDVVASPKDGHDRPESPMTDKSRRTGPHPINSPSTPRFQGQIGNVKSLGKGGGGLVRTKVGADGPGRSTEEATEREPWMLVGRLSDGNISHVTQLERELESELSHSEAVTAQVPEPRHVKYATVMAKNLRRGSHRTVHPGARRSVDKTRMTPEERRELVRAQREVMWNLQKGDIVTVVNPGDDPVPYKRQGNPDVNTPLSVKRRLALRKKPLIQEISNEYWCFPGLNPEGSDEMTKESYLKLNRKLHLALIPDTTDAEAQSSAEVDWVRDTQRWGGRMTREAFASSMFELADIWTENIDEEEYTAFLWLLLETITNTNVVPPSFKQDREIECIVDKDLSEATNRLRDTLTNLAEHERTPRPINTDAIAAVLSASRKTRGSLSPKLKDKHVQRLRALRQRLQALKQLRTWTAPGRPGEKNNGSGGDVGGVGGVEEVTEVDREEKASSRGKEDTSTEDREGAFVEEGAGGTAGRPPVGGQSRPVTRKDSGTALEDGEKEAEGLGSEFLGYSLPSTDDEARDDGRVADSEGGSDADQVVGPETDVGDTQSVGRDRVDIGHHSDISNLPNSSHYREEVCGSARDNIRENGAVKGDSTEDRETSRLYHRPGTSSSTAPSSPSVVNSNVSTNDKPLRRASGSRGGQVFSNTVTSRQQDVDGDGSTREILDKNNDGIARGEILEGVRGVVHSANTGNGNSAERGRGDQKYPGHVSTKHLTAVGAAGDVENSGFGNDRNSQGQARRKERGDDAHAGLLPGEGVADANGHQKPAQSSSEEREGKEAVQNQLRVGDVGGMDPEGAITEHDKGSGNSNVNDDSDRNSLDDGEAHRLFLGHDTTDGLSLHGRTRSTSGGENRTMLQGQNLGVGTSDNALIREGVGFNKPAGARDDREPGGGSGDPTKHHGSKGGDLGPKLGNRKQNTAAATVSSPRSDSAAGIRDRWTTSVPGGVNEDDGLLSDKPEESSRQDDGSSTTSSKSNGRCELTPTEHKEAMKAVMAGKQEQEQDDGVEGGIVSGDGGGQHGRRSAGGGTRGASHDVLSSAKHKGHSSRRQSARGSNGASGSAQKGRFPSTQPFQGSRPGKVVPSKFRPGGVRSGWDGISGTTDAEWDKMIQQAKEERKRRMSTSTSTAKRGSTARKKRPSGKVKGPKSSSGSTTKASPETTGSREHLSEVETSGPVPDGEASLSGRDIQQLWDDEEEHPQGPVRANQLLAGGSSYTGDTSKEELATTALPAPGVPTTGAGVNRTNLAPLALLSPNEKESEEEDDGGVSGNEGVLSVDACMGDRHLEEIRKSFSSQGGDKAGLYSGRRRASTTNTARETVNDNIHVGAGEAASNLKVSPTFAGPGAEDATSHRNGVPQDALAREQPPPEKYNVSEVGVFDGSSTASDPQGFSSLGAQHRPVETCHNPSHNANTAGTSSTISNGHQSGRDLDAVGNAQLGMTVRENGTAGKYQPVVQDGLGGLQPREGIPAARSNVVEYAPEGFQRPRHNVADGDTNVASLDWSPSSAPSESGRDEIADDNRPYDVNGKSMNAHDVHVKLAKRPNMVAASSRSDTNGDGSLQQEETRRLVKVAGPVDELVGSSASRTPRGNTMPHDGMPPPDRVDGRRSLPGDQNGLAQGASPQKRDPGSLSRDQGRFVVVVPTYNGTADEISNDPAQDMGKPASAFGTNLDVHQEDPATEGLLELHHGYRQIARPRTRSGSRAGTMGYGSEGGNREGTTHGHPPAEMEDRKVPVKDETVMKMATPELVDELSPSNLEETGRASDSSSRTCSGSKLDEQSCGQSAPSTKDPTRKYPSQSDAVDGGVEPPLNERSTAGASPETGTMQKKVFFQPSSQDTVELSGDATTTDFTALATAIGEKKAVAVMGSWKGGDLDALNPPAEKAGNINPRMAVPSYLSSSERGRKDPKEVRLGFGSDEADDGSVMNDSVLDGAQMQTQRARDPPASRRTAGQNGNVLGSIAVAGKRMSIDSENVGEYQQGAATGSHPANGRKSFTARGRHGDEVLQRSSSSGVWRYDDEEQHQRQQSQDAESWTSLSINPSPQGDAGKTTPPALDGRVSPGLRIGEPRGNSQHQHRLHSSRQVANSNDSHSASAPEGFGENPGVTSDEGAPVDKTNPWIVLGGGNLLVREERELDEVRKLSAENPGAEEAPFGIVGRGATLSVPFSDANTAQSRQGGASTPQRSAVVQGNSTAAVKDGRESNMGDADAGLAQGNTTNGGGVEKADDEDMPVESLREEHDAGDNDLVPTREGSSHRDQRHAVASSRRDNTEMKEEAHAAGREEMAVTMAPGMSSITSTQNGEAQVRRALTRNGGGDEPEEARRDTEKGETPTTLPEQGPALLGARRLQADQSIPNEGRSAEGNGAEFRAGDRLQRKRAQDQTEVRPSFSLVTRSNKHQRKGPDNELQVLADADRGRLVPDSRPRQDRPRDNGESTTRGRNTTGRQASLRRGMRHDETGLGRLRPQSAEDSGGRTGREKMDTDGEVDNRLESAENGARLRMRQRGPLNLSGPKGSNGPRNNNDGSIPGETTENAPRDKRRRGPQKSSPPAAQVSSSHGPDLSAVAEKRGKVRGTKRSWGAPSGETVERTAAQSPSANVADNAVRNFSGHRPDRGDIGSDAGKEQPGNDGQRVASAQNNDHDRFARDRPGDRYYLPPPERNSRPRTSPDDSGRTNGNNPRLSEGRRKDLQQRPRELREHERQTQLQGEQRKPRKTSRDVSRRSDGVDDTVDSSSSLQSRRREVRTSSSSDRLYRQQPADHRPMLGTSEASGASNTPDWRYGWRGSFSASLAQSQEEESLPYYVDRKQVWQFVPPDGLPPWRDPGPGEPGWEPILNYCEVKPDEEEVMEERKRRDFLCERRSRSRGKGADWSITTGGSSVGGRSNSLTSARSRVSSVRDPMDSSVASATTGGGDIRREGDGDDRDEHEDGSDGRDGGEDGENPFSSLEFPIAMRVNARRPSTTATGAVARSKPRENVDRNVAGSSISFSTASFVGHQPEISESPPSKPRLPDNNISSLGSTFRSETSAKEGLAANDFSPSAPTEPTRRATRTTMKRPRTGDQATGAPPRASFSRSRSPLLGGDGASDGASPPQLVNTTAHAAAAVAPASTVGGERRATLEYPPRQRRYSSLSFAQNPQATTAEMIRRYRGQLRRASSSSQLQRPSVAVTLTTIPPLLSEIRRRSEGSTPWHYYVTTNNTAGSGSARRPRTSIGGSRWSQDVRLQQHMRGRSRLAPATRTAGGRWGANHGRLEALVPGDESEASSSSITYRIPPEGGGPWVLDSQPRIELRGKPEQEYPFPF